jgi:hypothetical protein
MWYAYNHLTVRLPTHPTKTWGPVLIERLSVKPKKKKTSQISSRKKKIINQTYRKLPDPSN